MADHRFYFQIPGCNVFDVIWALSLQEAQHKLMNSSYAPYYSRVKWLTTDKDYAQDDQQSKLAPVRQARHLKSVS